MTSFSAVCVSEKRATFVAVSPAFFPAAKTSVSFTFDALPLG